MGDYRVSAVSGQKRTRSYQQLLDNRLNVAPTLTYLEEEVLDIGAETISLGATGSCTAAFSPTGTIPLLDASNNPTGETATHALLEQILRSLYIQTALERDAAILAAQPT